MSRLTVLEQRLGDVLARAQGKRTFPVLTAALALALTVSMTLPVASLVAAAVLLQPTRWRAVAACSALGTALGGLVLYLLFHHLGWNQLAARFPEMTATPAWREANDWLGQYGTWAILVISASPLPQTPALALAGITRLPVFEVLAALMMGKLVKYSVYAWAVARFPARFLREDRALALGSVGQRSRGREGRDRAE